MSLPLVQEFKLLVLVDHLEKSSILSAELQAAETPLANAAARPIRVNVRIVKEFKRETRKSECTEVTKTSKSRVLHPVN